MAVFKNDSQQYGLISKILHWLMALIMLGMIASGLFLDVAPTRELKFQVISLHKSFGVLILYLIGVRILWMAYTKKPNSIKSHAKWEKYLSKIVHLFLYIGMIGMPLSGILMSQSAGYPVGMFGVGFPTLVEKSEDLNHMTKLIHEYLAYALIIGILMHAAGAIKHHFLDKDETLKRMLMQPYVLSIGLIGLVLGVWLFAIARLLLF